MQKNISVFIDESGDFGFIKDASKYYLITLVFHNQNNDISNNIGKIANCPVFHAGPIIRKEPPFHNIDAIERKKYFQKFLIFTIGLPIKSITFAFNKKDFNNDILKMEQKMIREIYSFFTNHLNYFIDNKLIIYYDNGQHSITKILNSVLALTGLNYEFKQKVHPQNYRLFQVADFISTIKLIELKMNHKEMSKSEKMFFDNRHFKKNYLKAINKKELS